MPDPRTKRHYNQHGDPIVNGTALDALADMGPRVKRDYQTFKEKFVKWLRTRGKNPRRREGYSDTTIGSMSEKLDRIYQWKWDDHGSYTTTLTPEDADRFIKHIDWDLGLEDTSINVYVRTLKVFFKYRRKFRDEDVEWECDLVLSQKTVNIRDHFRKEELNDLYETSLEYGTVRHYNNCSSTEREQIRTVLSQRLGIPADEIGRQEFLEANSWKIPSLIAVAVDTGLRPIEVERSTVSWFQPVLGGKHEMIIPKEDSSKNENNWRPSLSPRASKAIQMWLDERDALDRYANTDAVWLTKYGNPYRSDSLNTILRSLMDAGEIDRRGRELSWYCIRHGVATMWANEHGLHWAKQQLRHNSIETTQQYVHPSPENRSRAAGSLW
jgi:site-specific recombinase XerD